MKPAVDTLAVNSIGKTSFPDVRDFFALMKPRVMSLVVFTALTGLVMTPGHMHPVVAFACLLCIAIGAGASGALNMWFDADIDALMLRTRGRPVPSGRVDGETALSFGLTLSAGSVLSLGLFANWLAASLLAFTIFFYAVVYTIWLKRFTVQNIVIGGAAGALPPMIAAAAVSGTVTLDSVLLFAIIFLWTPPHFWALALLKSDDYKRAGVPMLPVVQGEKATRLQILIYSIFYCASAQLPWIIGSAGRVYAVTAVISSTLFMVSAVLVYVRKHGARAESAARGLFAYSILQLFILFAALLVEFAFLGV